MVSEFNVTISQVPTDGLDRATDWSHLIDHVEQNKSDLVVLPEMPFYRWLPATDDVNADLWDAAVQVHDDWVNRLDDLAPATVIGSRPVRRNETRLNEGFVWDADAGYRPAHHKVHLPDEEGFWEASWYDPGSSGFSPIDVGDISVGFLICTELWAMEQVRAYSQEGVHFLVTPRATSRATSEKWLAAGRTAAVVSGAFSLSANRVSTDDETDPRFGGQSWCFGPDGDRLAVTSEEDPFLTITVNPANAERAQDTYPRYALE